MTDDHGTKLRLPIAADVKEPGALGRANPLVAIARVVSGPKGFEIQRDHARGVRAVHERVDPPAGQRADNRLDRKDETGLAGDVIDHD